MHEIDVQIILLHAIDIQIIFIELIICYVWFNIDLFKSVSSVTGVAGFVAESRTLYQLTVCLFIKLGI